MEEVKLVVSEQFDFENLDVIVDSVFGIFGRSQIGSKRHTRYGFSAGVAVEAPQKTKKPCQ